MGCTYAKLSPSGHAAETQVTQQGASAPRPRDSSGLGRSKAISEDAYPLGVKLYGLAAAGDGAASALLCSRLVVARGHILAAVFEGHASPAAAEYCRHHCWDAFIQALGNPHNVPAATTLRLLDRGFLTSSQQSLEARLSSGCSATLLHIDLVARTATVATVGARGAVALGSVVPEPSCPAAALRQQQWRRWRLWRLVRWSGTCTRQQGAEAEEEARGRRRSGCLHGRIGRVVSLEAPSAEGRRGLSGQVDIVQSALALQDASCPSPLTSTAAAAAASSVASGATAAALGGGSGGTGTGGSDRGGPAFAVSRRGGLVAVAPPRVLVSSGGAKDGLLAPPPEGASSAAASGVAAASSAAAALASTMAQPPPAHGLGQPPAVGGRFAALSRIHCACDVRAASRPLDAGDECFVLLGGSGGSTGVGGGGGSSNSGGPRGALRVGSGAGSGGGEAGAGAGGGPRAFIGSTGVGGGGSSSSQVHSSMLFLQSPSGPAAALSAVDAVTLAHELAAGALGGQELAAASETLPGGKRLDLLYDSLEAERSRSEPQAVTATATDGWRGAGDRSALAVASYALAATSLRDQGLDVGRRSSGGTQPVQTPSAACVVVWLDWRPPASPPSPSPCAAAAAASISSTVAALPAPLPAPLVTRRWALFRAYCRFRVARHRRIIACWHGLVAQIAAGPPVPLSLPAHLQKHLQEQQQQQPWILAQLSGALALALGNASATANAQNSVESCAVPSTPASASVAAAAATTISRTASFTSRPPVMMEFVEALPTSKGSAAVGGLRPRDIGAVASGGTAVFSVDAAAIASASVNAMGSAVTAATLDESHSASATQPYGISGLVVAPMGSTEEADADADGDAEGDEGLQESALGLGRSQLGALAAAAATQRSFLVRSGVGGATGLRRSAMARDSGKRALLQGSHSSPDLLAVEARAQPQHAPLRQMWRRQQHQAEALVVSQPSAAGGCAGLDSSGTAAAAAAQAEALAFACGTAAGFSSHRTAGGASATAASGCAMDWSLVMTSVTNTSGPRTYHSAGHTPIPSSNANRVLAHIAHRDGSSQQLGSLGPATSTGLGSLRPGATDSSAAAAAASSGGGGGSGGQHARVLAGHSGDLQGGSGGYLPITGRAGWQLRKQQQAHLAPSPPPAGSGIFFPRLSGVGRAAAAAAAGGGARRPPPEGCAADPLPPGVLVGRRSAGEDPEAEGDTDTDPCCSSSADQRGTDATETDSELISEDLPQLRIESTAELAALMAEIIITEDGEVVRTAGGLGSGGGAVPPPYVSRSHHHHVAGHKASRAGSRQGSRGWQPRLAIVREDAREANSSTSCSQVLLGEGLRFTAVSEERSQSSSSSNTMEHLQGSASERSSLAHSRGSSGSPNGSVEEAVAAFGSIVTTAAMGVGAAGLGPLLAPAVPGAVVPVNIQSPFATAAGATTPGAGPSTSQPPAVAPPSTAPVVPSAIRGAVASAFVSYRRPLAGPPVGPGKTPQPPLHPWFAAPAAGPGMGTVPEGDVLTLPASPISTLVPRESVLPFGRALPGAAAAEKRPASGPAVCHPAGAIPAAACLVAPPPASEEGEEEGEEEEVAAVVAVGSSGDGGVAIPRLEAGQPQPLELAADVAVALPPMLPPPLLSAPPTATPLAPPGPFTQLPTTLRHLLDADAGAPNDGTAAQPMTSAAVLEDVLKDLTPSLDRERILVEAAGCLASGGGVPADARESGSGSSIIVVSASVSPTRVPPLTAAAYTGTGLNCGAGVDFEAEVAAQSLPAALTNSRSSGGGGGAGSGSGSLSSGGGLVPKSVTLGPVAEAFAGKRRLGRSRSRSRSSTQLRSLAAGNVPAAAAEGQDDLIMHGGGSSRVSLVATAGDRPTLGLVSRSLSMLVTRQRPNPQQLQLGFGRGCSPAVTPLVGAQRHSQHQHPHGQHPAGIGRNTRRLYGLADSTNERAAAVARSSSSAAAATVAAVPPHSVADGATATTIDRTWSAGSASGPLYSLLHSTLSKSSITGLMSTAVPTPGCTSTQGSNNRLPTLPASSVLSPGQQTPGAAAAAAATAVMAATPGASGTAIVPYGGGGGSCCPAGGVVFGRALPRSLSAFRHEPSGLGTPTQPGSGGTPMALQLSTAPEMLLQAPPLLPQPATEYDTALLTDSPAFDAAGTPRPAPLAPWLGRPGPFGALPLQSHVHSPALLPHLPSDISPAAPPVKPSSHAAAAASPAEAHTARRSTDVSPPQHLGPTGAVPWAPPPPHRACVADSAATGPIAPADNVAASYDDGAVTNRSSYISRSDASVWNSTSVWTNSTGRTADILGNGSSRRVGGSGSYMTAGLGGGIACGIVTGGDTSGLIACNGAYSSVSGLLMTADAGAPGSNTQLLMQMAGAGAPGQSNSNAQHSTQLLCSPHQTLSAFSVGVGASSGGGGGGYVGMTAPDVAAVVAPPRALAGSQTPRHALLPTSPPGRFSSQPRLQGPTQPQSQPEVFLDSGPPQQPRQLPQLLQPPPRTAAGTAACATAAAVAPAARQPHLEHCRSDGRPHPHPHPALQDTEAHQRDTYRSVVSMYDSGAEVPYMMGPGGGPAGVFDTASSNLMFGGNSTYNNAAHLSPLLVSNGSRTAASGNAPRASRGLGSEHHGLLGMGLDTEDALIEG